MAAADVTEHRVARRDMADCVDVSHFNSSTTLLEFRPSDWLELRTASAWHAE